MIFSEEQQRRLGELGATSEDLQAGFADSAERNRAFQRLESRLVMEQHERLDALCEGPRRPFILELEERLSAVLRTAGFLQVHTPIILSRARLEKMGVFDGSIMEKQVFWIDSKRCLRPMLAPHLYMNTCAKSEDCAPARYGCSRSARASAARRRDNATPTNSPC